jgi:hypothetical protein
LYDLLQEADFEVYLVNAPVHEEPTRAEERCAGESVADEAAHVWLVAQLLPSAATDSLVAELLAAAAESRVLGG